MDIELRSTITAGDIKHLATELRVMDKIEVRAATGETPLQAICLGVDHSVETTLVTIDEEPVCIFGIVRKSLFSDVYVPWMLGTAKLDDYAISLLRISRKVIAYYLAKYGPLENYVYAGNSNSIVYLQWLGFSLDEPKPHGVYGKPFRRFYKGQ